MANSETILTLTYDFLLYLIPQLSKYPRDQKFVLGDRIETLALFTGQHKKKVRDGSPFRSLT